jgi:hypothetical protein
LRVGTTRRWLQRHSVEKMLKCGAVQRSMAEAASSSSTSCVISVLRKKKIEGEKRIGEGKKKSPARPRELGCTRKIGLGRTR